MTISLSHRIDRLFAKERWRKARTVLENELLKAPEDHWLLARLATTYYEDRDYVKALEIAAQAHTLAPHCPLVLWERAGALQMIGHTKQALEVYGNLLARNVSSIAQDECGEGEEWAIALLTDCTFRVATCWEDLEETDIALPYFLACLDMKVMGAGGIYSKRDIEKEIKKLVKSNRTIYLEQKLEKLGELSTAK